MLFYELITTKADIRIMKEMHKKTRAYVYLDMIYNVLAEMKRALTPWCSRYRTLYQRNTYDLIQPSCSRLVILFDVLLWMRYWGVLSIIQRHIIHAFSGLEATPRFYTHDALRVLVKTKTRVMFTSHVCMYSFVRGGEGVLGRRRLRERRYKGPGKIHVPSPSIVLGSATY